MPEDLLKMAQDALGGRWYRCPNGHPFYVDLCGRPTRIQTCPDCGSQIGGLDHNLLEGNIDIGNVGTDLYQRTTMEDKSEPNYCLRSAEDEAKNKFATVRALNPSSTRGVRLLLHSCCLVAAAAQGPAWEDRFFPLVNRELASLPSGEGQEEAGASGASARQALLEFIVDHWTSNWDLLKTFVDRNVDEVALLLHTALLSAGGGSTADLSVLQRGAVPAPPPPAAAGAFEVLRSSLHRNHWEQAFDALHLSPCLNAANLAEVVHHMGRQVSPQSDDEGDGQGGVFVAEMQEAFDPRALTAAERSQSVVNLWRYRRPFSLAHFLTALKRSGEEARFPALTHFLEQEPQLRALAHLPACLDWVALLLRTHNRHLARERARTMTVGDALLEASQVDKPLWVRAWEGFRDAWNSNWQYVSMFGCQEIPAEYRDVVMREDTQLSFCLPCREDEGICPLALIQHLAALHNGVVAAVDERELTSARQEHHASRRTRLVSSRHLTSAHTIRYDLENDVIPYFAKQCVTQSGYDFSKAEARLIDQHLSGAPAIDLEMKTFTFAHEQHLQGGLAPLKAKIPQERLAPEICEAIARELASPTRAQAILDLLETVVPFIVSTGGSYVEKLSTDVGDLMLAQYIKTVLLMEDAMGTLGRAISAQVQLKHIEALWGVLEGMTEVDPFAQVHQKYRHPIVALAVAGGADSGLPSEQDDAEVAQLTQFFTALDEEQRAILMAAVKSYIIEQLVESTTANMAAMKSFIGYKSVNDTYLVDLDWYDEFPESTPMACALEVYRLFERLS